MNVTWNIDEHDITKLNDFVAKHKNHFVERVIERNVNRINIRTDKDSILEKIIMCLITSQQPSGPNSTVGIFLNLKPFPLTYETVLKSENVEELIKQTMQQNKLNRFINRIPVYFNYNFQHLETTNWEMFSDIETKLSGQHTKQLERTFADNIADTFKGFGAKQSRNFLQALGLTKYEIPIDSRITTWLNDFGFPVKLSPTALQDKAYYHFVSDGFQTLCVRAGVLPCVLDATIFSSFDNGQWTKENNPY